MATSKENELKLIDKTSAEFSRNELAQIMEKSGSEYFSPEYMTVLEKAWDLDFFHILLPESVGGNGLGCAALCTVLKNICTEDSSLGVIILTTIAAYEILLESEQESLLTEFPEDQNNTTDFLIGFPLFSNPVENGINVVATRTPAGFSLTGSLAYLVLAGLAQKALIPATIEGETGFSYFLADLTQANVTVGDSIRGLGISACPVSDITLDKVSGTQCCHADEGFRIFKYMSSKLSVALAAMETGIMMGSFKDAFNYANNRRQGGRKIIHWSEIKKTLSGMAMNIQLAEMLLKQCCASMETGEKGWSAEADALSVKIADMAYEVTTDGIKVMGGVGYMKDFHQERRFRDARHLMSVFGIQQFKKLSFLENHISKSAVYHI